MKRFIYRFFAVIAICSCALLIDGCGFEKDDDGDPSGRAAKEIGPEGGTVAVTDSDNPLYGVRVTIPAGALAQKTTISIEEGPYGATFPAGVSYDHPVVNFAPDVTFLTDVEITFPITYIPTNEEDILGAYYDSPTKARWIIVPARSVNSDNITIRTRDFGLYSWGTIRLSEVDDSTIMASMGDMQTMFDAWNQLTEALKVKVQQMTSALQNPANFNKCATQNAVLSLLATWRQQALQSVTTHLATAAVQDNCKMCGLITGACTPYTCDPNKLISGQPIEWLRQEADIWFSDMFWSASCPIDLLGPLAGKMMAFAKYSAAVEELQCDWRCVLQNGDYDFYFNLLLGNVCTFSILGIEMYRTQHPCTS